MFICIYVSIHMYVNSINIHTSTLIIIISFIIHYYSTNMLLIIIIISHTIAITLLRTSAQLLLCSGRSPVSTNESLGFLWNINKTKIKKNIARPRRERRGLIRITMIIIIIIIIMLIITIMIIIIVMMNRTNHDNNSNDE